MLNVDSKKFESHIFKKSFTIKSQI